MLIGWGLFGWTAFLSKRFAKGSDLVKKMCIFASKGNMFVGFALIALSAWKTASRDKCSTDSAIW